MKSEIMKTALLTMLLTIASAAPAMAAVEDLQTVYRGDIIYMSGGVGLTERDAMKAKAHDFNLLVSNADKKGMFTADTNVTLTSKKGNEEITVKSTGPLFYAKLPPGKYTLKAENGDQKITRTVRVAEGKPTDVHLIWKD